MIMMKRYKKILLTGVLSALSCSFVHAQELYKNENAPVHERVMDLISRLTVEEKISLLRATSPGIPRLGIDKYYHGNEALHGVVRPGRFTVFPQAIGLAATWNPELQKRVATVISDEARARWNELDQGREQKEQFSDGVGYSWIDTLKEITSQAVSDKQMAHASERFPINPPMNKEEYYYRCIFEEYFPSDSAARSVPSVPSVACSTAEALAWDTSFKGQNEPSGRAVNGIHEDAYSKTEI